MAARRRSLEERNLKTLRELAALPANKQCFDCNQRGPTYINITIGSFVCTSCSGILRGLTPPHRAKSITMATFTPEEIDFLKSRGNEYCRYVWLGTYDSRTSNVDSDLKDEHKKKELMSQKYEKKRWYVDPEIAMKKMQHDQFQPKPAVQSATNRPYARVPEIQPLSQLLGKMPTSLVVENHQHNEKWPNPVSSASTVMTNKNATHNQATPHSTDFLSQFATDTFVSPSNQGSTANGNFANFDSAFNDSDKPEMTSSSSVQFFSNNNRTAPPTGWTSFDDDLDPLSPTCTSSGPPHVSSVSSSSSSRGLQQSGSSAMPRPLSLPTFVQTNPFKPFPTATNNLPNVSTPTQWPSFPASSSNIGMPASVSLDAYPSFAKTSKPGGLFSPPPPAPVTNASSTSKLQQHALQQSSQEDRYAALADLDVYFHQPTSATSPTWTVETTTTNTIATRFSASESNTNNVFTMVPSNPFITSSSSWKTSSKSAPTINPFQNLSESSPCLPYQQQSNMNPAFMPLPVVGNSPSEDVIRAQFNSTGNNVSFQPFNTNDVSNPPNGYRGGPFFMQNGEFVTSPTSQIPNWVWPATTSVPLSFTTSQHVPAPPSALNVSEKCPNQFTQYSDWMPNPANPFAIGSGTTAPPPKPSPTNPFL